MLREFATKAYLFFRDRALLKPKTIGRAFEGIAVGIFANFIGQYFDGSLDAGKVITFLLGVTLIIMGSELGDEPENEGDEDKKGADPPTSS